MIDDLIKQFGHIKVNLPSNFESYQSGNGEGIWAVCASQKDADIYNTPSNGSQFEVCLANNSFYYPYLTYGSKVLVETQGDNRPVAVWDNLPNTKAADHNKNQTLKHITENNL